MSLRDRDARKLLGSRHHCLQRGTSAELRDRCLVCSSALARARDAHHAGRAHGSFERTEARDGNLFALSDLARNRVEGQFQPLIGGPFVCALL